MANLLRFWYRNARSRALVQSLLPSLVAICMAWQSHAFSLPLALLALSGVVLAHLSMNLFDDFFDYRVKQSSYRDDMVHQGFRARIAKCDYLTSGQTNMRTLLLVASLLSVLSVACAVAIGVYRGPFILVFIALTGILGIGYSAPPLKLSYRGMGELLIGLVFGPLLMMGVYYSATGLLTWAVLFISLPMGLLVTNILYVHSIMDYEPDKQVGKMTFAVLLNNKRWMLAGLLVLLLAPFGVIVTGVATHHLSQLYLLLLLLLPMAASLFYMMNMFVKDPEHEFSPQLWMGPMTQWPRIQAMGIDWFMIRWLLARNMLMFFCLITIILSLVLGI